MTERLDDTDLKILRILQENAKMTTKEIADQLHLTASPVYERIKRLEQKKLNRPVTAICMVSLRYHNEGFIETFELQIKELVEVQECYHMAGKVDFFLKIHLESLEEYHEFVRTKLSKIQNIGVLESYFVLKEIYNTTTIAI